MAFQVPHSSPRPSQHLIAAGLLLVLGAVAPAVAAAESAGPLLLTPATADFGAVTVGSTGLVTLTARNDGATAVVVERVRVTSSPFSIDANLCLDKSLSPNASCKMTVRFAPTTSGQFSAVLEMETNVGTSSAALTGRGTPGGVTGQVTTGGTTGGTTTGGVTGGTTSAPPVTTSPPQTTTSAPARPTEPATTTITPPSTPTTRPSTSQPLADDQRLSECERQAHEANVSYEPTRKMSIGETQQVQVTASVGRDPVRTSVPSSRASTTLVPITLRCEVQAQLRGEDFKVNPGGFQQASFLDRPSVTWSWDVVPMKSGPRFLTLEIRSIAEIEGRRIEGAGGELFTTAIDVGVKSENFGQTLTRWSGGVVDHPLVRGFGSLAVVAGAALGVWRRLLGRRWPWSKQPS